MSRLNTTFLLIFESAKKYRKKMPGITITTSISPRVKDKNSIFAARDEDMIFLVKGQILVFH